MGLETKLKRTMEYVNAATYDPMLAALVWYGVVSMHAEPRANPRQYWTMLALTTSVFVMKNLFDYQRMGKHVSERGWTPDIFLTAYRGQAKLFAETNNMISQYEATKEEHRESRLRWF